MGGVSDNLFLDSFEESGGSKRFPDLELILDNIKISLPIPELKEPQEMFKNNKRSLNPKFNHYYKMMDNYIRTLKIFNGASYIFNGAFYPVIVGDKIHIEAAISLYREKQVQIPHNL